MAQELPASAPDTGLANIVKYGPMVQPANAKTRNMQQDFYYGPKSLRQRTLRRFSPRHNSLCYSFSVKSALPL